MVICLQRGADLHVAQLMPLPLTISCFSKIQIGFTFLVPAHPGSHGKRAVKRVCVCVLFKRKPFQTNAVIFLVHYSQYLSNETSQAQSLRKFLRFLTRPFHEGRTPECEWVGRCRPLTYQWEYRRCQYHCPLWWWQLLPHPPRLSSLSEMSNRWKHKLRRYSLWNTTDEQLLRSVSGQMTCCKRYLQNSR